MSAINSNKKLSHPFQLEKSTSSKAKFLTRGTPVKEQLTKEQLLGEEHKSIKVQEKSLNTRISNIDWWMQGLSDTLSRNSTDCCLPVNYC